MKRNRLGLTGNEERPGFFYGYAIVLASFLILMVVWGAQYSFGVFFKPVLNEFGWTRGATAGAYSLNTILVGILGIPVGRLSDRFGPRPVVTVCGLLGGLGYLLMSQTGAIWHMYLFYGVLVSFGIAGTWVPLLSTVARWFVRRSGLASGIAVSGIGIGMVIMPPLANQLISSYSWRTSYVIVGLVVMVLVVAVAQFLRRDPAQMGLTAYGAGFSAAVAAERNRDVPLREAVRSLPFWIMCAMFFSASFGCMTALVHIVPHATDIGIPAAASATILSVIGIVSIGGKIGMGGVVDKISGKRVMIAAFVLMMASFLWLLVAGQLWMLYLFAFAFAIAYAGYVTAQSPMVASYFGLRAHGAIFGLTMFAANAGGAVGSFVAGSLYDRTGSYTWTFVLCIVLGGLSLILSMPLRAGRAKEPAQERA